MEKLEDEGKLREKEIGKSKTQRTRQRMKAGRKEGGREGRRREEQGEEVIYMINVNESCYI